MITSPHNDKLKEIRRLNRRREARFVAEGEDLVEAAERAGWRPVYRLEAGVDVAPELLAEVSSLGSGTRVLAVYDRRWAQPTGPLCVALWGVRDPGNVGTVVRSARAFGAASVALGPDCADPFSPKAVRASMGAIFAVPVARVSDPAELPGERIALAARTGEPLGGPLAEPATIVVGAERTGLPDAVRAACERTAHIPIASESLNAAMAATVALYEATRGRVDAGAPERPAGAGADPPERASAVRVGAEAGRAEGRPGAGAGPAERAPAARLRAAPVGRAGHVRVTAALGPPAHRAAPRLGPAPARAATARVSTAGASPALRPPSVRVGRP
jgi:RNA methyltransferase, TrmH family